MSGNRRGTFGGGSYANERSITRHRERSNLKALRRWHKAVGTLRATGTATDVMIVGDSISEGWTATGGVFANTWAGVFQIGLSAMLNTAGHYGRWVPGGGNWYTLPHFNTNAVTTTTSGSYTSGGTTINLADASGLPSAGTALIRQFLVQQCNITWTGKVGNQLTGVTLSTPANYPSGSSIIYGSEEVSRGLSLRGRQMYAGAPAAELTFTGDRVKVFYRKRNLFGSADVVIKLDGVTQTTVNTTSTTGTWCSTAYGEELFVWDSGTISRASHTVSIEQASSGARTASIQFDGVYYHDTYADEKVRVFNCSHFGYNFNHYNSSTDASLNNDWLSAVRQGFVTPSLVIISHGTNESDQTPDVTEARLRQMIVDITAACTYAGTPTPSFAYLLPPNSNDENPDNWDSILDRYYKVADELGHAVWEWAEFTGDISDTSADPYTFTVDHIHPNKDGQVAIGGFALRKATEHLSPTLAIENLYAYLRSLAVIPS